MITNELMNYYRARKRYSKDDAMIPDSAIVAKQEHELSVLNIDKVLADAELSAKVREMQKLEDKLTDMEVKLAGLEEENKELKRKLSEPRTFRVGDSIQFSGNKYKIKKAEIDTNKDTAVFYGEGMLLFF